MALSPKCYFSLNMDDGSVKMGTKGVPHSANLQLDMFVNRLYTGKSFYVELESLRLNKKKEMARIQTRKKCLNDLFVKFHVAHDKVTCSPLKLNGEYL